jgi:hypothetical protein
VKPIQICQNLGQGHIDAYYDELSGKEVRAVLKAGGCSVNVPETAYTQAARRRVWRRRFDSEFTSGNDQLALALLLEWLMRHHRQMLVDYLDFLGVKHRQGETDEDFCVTQPLEKLQEGVGELLKKYPPAHVASYLLLVGHLQETPIYDQTPQVLTSLGMDAAAAEQYIEAHKRTYKAKDKREPQPLTGLAASA